MEKHKVSNIHQLRKVVMEEWKRTAVATCEALVISMPKRIKVVINPRNAYQLIMYYLPQIKVPAAVLVSPSDRRHVAQGLLLGITAPVL